MFSEFKNDDYCSLNGRIEVYFEGPKEIVEKITGIKYDEAVSTEVKLEFECTDITEVDYNNFLGASISPTRLIEEVYEDYDWTDIEINENDISTLIGGLKDEKIS